MKRTQIGIVLLLTLPLLAAAPTTMPAVKSNPGFDKLKTLVGEWQGKRPDGSPIHLSSKLASNDSAIVETLDEHGGMFTVYHPDGQRVMLTHYCALGNQPRMAAGPVAGDAKSIQFDFVDGTNMPSPNVPHMHKLKIEMPDDDHMNQEWTLWDEGKEVASMTFKFERVK